MMDFSIIIPSFNKADFISETITSVLNQSYPHWELVIVDDGSTDNSIQIIEDYCNIDQRIHLYQRGKLPKGGSVCRNLGLKKAKGKFVLFLDADDLLEVTCLEHRLLKIQENNTSNLWVFPIGTFYKSIGDSKSVWSPKGTNFLIRFLKHDLPWHTMSVIWHIDFIKNLKGFDIDYPRLQDVELHTRALLHPSVKLKTFPEVKSDAFYRIDDKRTNQNVVQQLDRQKLGVFMYMERISILLKSKKNQCAIKKTLFSFMTMVNYRCLVENKLKEFHIDLNTKIIDFMKNHSRFNTVDIIYIRAYTFFYKLGFWKIKGYNFLMKLFF